MEGDQRALVVFERGIWVSLVNDTLIRELLVVIAHLNSKYARILDPIIGDDKLPVVIYLRCKLVRS